MNVQFTARWVRCAAYFLSSESALFANVLKSACKYLLTLLLILTHEFSRVTLPLLFTLLPFREE